MQTFHCNNCTQQVFFDNTHCERCGLSLAFVPEKRRPLALTSDDQTIWYVAGEQEEEKTAYRLCSNYHAESVCNWAVPVSDGEALCIACRYNRTIPALIDLRRRTYWQRMESAKRRMLYTLLDLNLRPLNRRQNPQTGLAFDFLEATDVQPVLTGHSDGIITINIAEADDSNRERTREAMHEGYRTLLGHFRHEIGHYFFDRLIQNTEHEATFRALFGDERADYSEALKRHYDSPNLAWRDHFISAYASSHPWEDWAETWAHYLHITDTIGTAKACGIRLQPEHPAEPIMNRAHTPSPHADFDQVIQDWFALTYVLNSLNRSIGTPDSYPFTLPPAVIDKLGFVHDVVMQQKTRTSVGI